MIKLKLPLSHNLLSNIKSISRVGTRVKPANKYYLSASIEIS